MIPSSWSIGLVLSILAVVFGYLSWMKATSYSRTDIEEFLDNRLIGRTFGHEYKFDVAVSYTHTAEEKGDRLFPRSIDKLKEESIPFTLPEANIVLWGKIQGLEFDHLKGVDDPSSTGEKIYHYEDHPVWEQYHVESVTFRRKFSDAIECRVEFSTSEVATIRSALDDFDGIIDVTLKSNHESHTEIPDGILPASEDEYHFIK